MTRRGKYTVRVPGRVNLIGEHTDYNDGFVLPAAIDLAVTLQAEARTDGTVSLASRAFGEVVELEPGASSPPEAPAWSRRAASVLDELRRAGLPRAGFSASIESDLPLGGGLASSAAFEVAVALAAVEAARIAGLAPPHDVANRTQLAALCRDAEERSAGVRVGIMDPFVALHARPGTALLLDCRSLEFGAVDLDPTRISLVVADTGIRHELAESDYNLRRAECEQAVLRLRSGGLSPGALRDVPREGLDDALAKLPETIGCRVRHVVTENDRTLAAASALAGADFRRFGELLFESHESLRDDYQVSCPELDALVSIARAVPGVYGSRMTGGGFGGCTLTTVTRKATQSLLKALEPHSQARVVVPSGGASVVRA